MAEEYFTEVLDKLSQDQKDDILSIYVDEKGKPYKTAGKIDYVSGWYFKAAQLMHDTTNPIRTAFVSTNSITQGEQVASIWPPLFTRFNVHIDFAYRTFRWDSEASLKAHVHCVIIGFSTTDNHKHKMLYYDGMVSEVEHINAYLINTQDVCVDSRTKPLCNVPNMVYGNKPTDGGFLLMTPEEKDALVLSEPGSEKYIKRIFGAAEFINNKERYCLWLVGASPAEIRKSKMISARIESVKQFRLESTKKETRESAQTPTLFQEIRQPITDYIVVPEVSSGTRRYIPMGFMSPDIICTNKIQFLPDAKLYHFGVMESNVHMAWTRAVCGRLKSDYDYSAKIVYNNFPWPTPTDAQKAKIEQTAQDILDARALYPDCSLADLYDEVTMPPELRKAHQRNDRAVMEAYGFWGKLNTETDCVAALMAMYAEMTKGDK